MGILPMSCVLLYSEFDSEDMGETLMGLTGKMPVLRFGA
jgi:hypothetical protein